MSVLMQSGDLLKGDNTVPGVRVPPEILKEIPGILKSCRDWGLDFYPTVVEFMDYDGISEVAAYGGFPVRFPHWSWGEQYEDLSRGYEYGMHRIYEMVVNTNPCYIYCLDSNTWVDHVTVIAHATGHNDFFKNNIFFSQTSQNMLNELANHGTRIKRYMQEWGEEKIGRFIDKIMSIETLIDSSKAWHRRVQRDPIPEVRRKYEHPRRLKVEKGHEHMEDWINSRDYLDSENERIKHEEIYKGLGLFGKPEKDIFGYLKDHAPLKPWEQDIISMLYEEAMYFAPQGQTKMLNEGHACLRSESLVQTNSGFITMGELAEGNLGVNVSDSVNQQSVTNWFKFENMDTVEIKTRRGITIDGSATHRIMVNGEWKRLDQFKVGDAVQLAVGTELWATEFVKVDFKPAESRTRKDIAEEASCSMDTVRRHRKGEKTSFDAVLTTSFETYRGCEFVGRRNPIIVPEMIDVKFGSFLGHMTGDGHISKVKRSLGLTTGDEEQADAFVALSKELFGIEFRKKWCETKWRVLASNTNLEHLLVSLGLPTGVSARRKVIPPCVLRSPKPVVAAFLRALYDCDGYAGKEGVILSSSSIKMAKMVQVVLLNFGIYSRRYVGGDENWKVYSTGLSAKKFYEEIGFGLTRKQEALKKKLDSHKWYKKETDQDEVKTITCGKGTVYDITVNQTHRYVAQGFLNHNSRTDSQIMAQYGLAKDDGIVEYAAHKAGVLGGKTSMNPYKLGYLLLTDIEERWNKGQFGKEWDECTDNQKRAKWDKKLGLGHDKIFEVRKYYNDVTALSEFFTQEFCDKHQFYNWRRFPDGTYKIMERDAEKIKASLIQKYMNRGLPIIKLVEPNYKGKRIFLMEHTWDGRTLHPKYTQETMRALSFIWRGPCAILTKDKDEKQIMYYCEDDNVKVG